MRKEKEQALAEETQATLAALDAMRKAHESEVNKEVEKFKKSGEEPPDVASKDAPAKSTLGNSSGVGVSDEAPSEVHWAEAICDSSQSSGQTPSVRKTQRSGSRRADGTLPACPDRE